MPRLITQIFVYAFALLWASGCVVRSHGGHHPPSGPVYIEKDVYYDDHHHQESAKQIHKMEREAVLKINR